MPDTSAIHDAYLRGDLDGLKALLGDPPDFPNCPGPADVGPNVLEYAIYWSPFSFIRALLDLGADPNYDDPAGFPSLIAALSTERADKPAILRLLLSHGADVQQRGVNDFTPLHYAASLDEPEAIAILLDGGADPSTRTRIDEYETALELAERANNQGAVHALKMGRAP
ncbi:MAG: ankyrin repeat domain-containing protein [Alphaproteobacteria bacterium]